MKRKDEQDQMGALGAMLTGLLKYEPRASDGTPLGDLSVDYRDTVTMEVPAYMLRMARSVASGVEPLRSIGKREVG